MNDNKTELTTTMKENAENAAKLEAEVLSAPDKSVYTHEFKRPFTYNGKNYARLTFDWDGLTARDSLAVEKEMRNAGITLVVPAFTGEYLAGMAIRACTRRDEDGNRVIDGDALRAMPMRDFLAICNQARNFLLHAESAPETGAAGSENKA